MHHCNSWSVLNCNELFILFKEAAWPDMYVLKLNLRQFLSMDVISSNHQEIPVKLLAEHLMPLYGIIKTTPFWRYTPTRQICIKCRTQECILYQVILNNLPKILTNCLKFKIFSICINDETFNMYMYFVRK